MKAWFATSLVFLLWPVAMGSRPFVSISEVMVIQVPKDLPPHIAFSELIRESRMPDDWDAMDRVPAQTLSTETIVLASARPVPAAQPDIVLEALPIRQPAVVFGTPQVSAVAPHTQIVADAEDRSWMEALTPAQQKRWSEAEKKYGRLIEDEKPEIPIDDSYVIDGVIPGSPALAASTGGAVAKPANENPPSTGVTYAWNEPASSPDSKPGPAPEKTNGGGTNSGTSIAQVMFDPGAAPDAIYTVKGALEISGGLAVTDVHRLEILRRQEGVIVDRGEVNLRAGSYQIKLQGRQGEVLARLIDGQGRILGEGGFRVSHLQGRGTVSGPKITVSPRVDLGGTVASYYGGAKLKAMSGGILKNALPLEIAKTGEFEVTGFERGSTSVLQAAAPGYMSTQKIVIAGENADVQLFPLSMMKALRSIASEHQQMDLTDPEGPIVWGRIVQDGKPLSGLTVEIESAQGNPPIYFNEFLIPDPNLKATSSNGLFAFVMVPEGFHAIVARRGEGFFGHQNVVTSAGNVSTTEISNSIRTEQVVVRSYDAFTGEPRPAQLLHQASEATVDIGPSGMTVLLLPMTQRLSLVDVRPDSPYVPSRLIALDSESFLHVPLVREDWLLDLRGRARIDDGADDGVIVGFVPEENFSVDLVGVENARVLYFDVQGRFVQDAKVGPAGGGFVVFNSPTGVQEIVVTGENSGRIMSRMAVVDPRSVTVATFKTDEATVDF